MTMRIEKGPLPKGMSFILKSSAFADALSEAGIEIDTQMIYGAGGIFFDAHFWAPNENVGYERLYVRVGAVSNNVAAAARRYVEHSVLPELIAWIAELLALPRNSPLRRQQQYFVRHQPEHFIP
ncbi:hypothetical protein E5F05_14570 [Deinococcus metallilatus]|uniref:Uncharacterized protein n=1 Tax=Deinococcus metallilatus TaxID=1211322 RepID=A0AAJ5F8T9_9DEIO|nr:hypothetical protein [Deinococcus metallilatus]MBB5294295.1 hypothetical protein [Deinococcus metallilatus]QBY09067.1 hypothetical protein E5F05_14570 [Deinococcus metallilatus]RXJ10211.1 hypothetical protein ERJ73_13400 [Deinococcus metallilatus]TLK27852.1 hypothetical protein FCS05_07980 [Deinococcus metallilatus]GMA16368.1 hypothetical protein GCM10025871_26990 [Deinococcus metallilatus]